MYDPKNTEEKINKFWKKEKIFQKSVEKSSPKGDFIFYDGPPFITGLPHYGTLLPSIVKDVIPRYWTMKGYKVERRWGWDCHGLPAENQVEKELGLKNKKDIEKFGIGKFVGACKLYVNNVSDQWNWYIEKIARWVDMDDAYKTMDLEFMESVMWAFKKLYDQDLIYEGFRTSLHCPRCATPLSKFEITMDAGAYQDVTELSIVLKFKLKEKFKERGYASILVWTTTPWTLPGNLALAINEKISYVLIESKKENYILAKERTKDIFKDKDYKIIKEFKGRELIGLEYVPLFDLKNKEISENKNSYKVISENFVNVEDGTGVVHIAPNFGEDDFEAGKEHDLPIIEIMDENGAYTNEAGEWEGTYFKDAGKKVLQNLGEKLFDKFNFTHPYPFCYRCQTPLIYKTQKSWYLNINKIRSKMLKTNKKINWVPNYFKEGRFKYNLENAPDWSLSRSRYWGSPMPIWKCEKCEKLKVVGSVKEIEKLSGKKVNDLHIPKIDSHKFKCECGGVMSRIPEVLDCWFESGSMPYAQMHYPFERKKYFDKNFPADFIIEYTGQLRGWFYYLHVLSNSLFDSECFKNVVVTGVLAGEDGRKMSKLYGNYPDPKETLEKYGGDSLRMYFLSSPVITGGDLNISEKGIIDSYRKNIILLDNVYQFYNLLEKTNISNKNILDKWIISRLNELVKEVKENLEKYEIPLATRPITKFIDDLSLVYIKQNRDRLNKGDKEAYETLENVLEIFSKIIAPFMPFISEEIWQGLTKNNFNKKNKSVHLETFPDFDEKLIDKKLINEMNLVREIISSGLKTRDKIKIGLKWPLAKAMIFSKRLGKELEKIIETQLNVKNIEWENTDEQDLKVEFDTKMNPELEAEGYAREMTRQVQAFRKKLGLIKTDKIKLFIVADEDLKNILKKQKDFIQDRTNSSKFEIVTTGKERFKKIIEFKIKDKRGWIAII